MKADDAMAGSDLAEEWSGNLHPRTMPPRSLVRRVLEGREQALAARSNQRPLPRGLRYCFLDGSVIVLPATTRVPQPCAPDREYRHADHATTMRTEPAGASAAKPR